MEFYDFEHKLTRAGRTSRKGLPKATRGDESQKIYFRNTYVFFYLLLWAFYLNVARAGDSRRTNFRIPPAAGGFREDLLQNHRLALNF